MPAFAIPLWKRGIDVTIVGLSFPLLLPLVLCVAIWIRHKAGGPVLFRQERVGRGGRPFTIYKFRTMPQGADQRVHKEHVDRLVKSNGQMEKLDKKGDPRVIPGMRLVRAIGLDELPQLWNVLRGEMSLVGPRPCVAEELEYYRLRQLRFAVQPGLTGYWQVSGKNKNTFEKQVAMDEQYVRQQSPWTDLWILLVTPLAVLRLLLDCLATRRVRRSKSGSKAGAFRLVPGCPEGRRDDGREDEDLPLGEAP